MWTIVVLSLVSIAIIYGLAYFMELYPHYWFTTPTLIVCLMLASSLIIYGLYKISEF